MVRLDLGTKDGVKSMRIGFTDQRLTAHGGLAVWSRSVTERGLREQLRAVLPHTPTSPNAYDPCDTALGFIGGILCGADKLARVAHLAHDPAVAEVLGIEAIPSQSTLSRFFAQCGRSAGEALSGLHRWVLEGLPARTEGYTLDLDSFSLLHEDGHQEGVRVGYTRKGLKPCHRPIVAALAEVPQVAHFWLRLGNTACVSGAATFLGHTIIRLPATVRVTLVRADSGFCTHGMIAELEARGLRYILTAALRAPVRTLCRHDDAAWTPTAVPASRCRTSSKTASGWSSCVSGSSNAPTPAGSNSSRCPATSSRRSGPICRRVSARSTCGAATTAAPISITGSRSSAPNLA